MFYGKCLGKMKTLFSSWAGPASQTRTDLRSLTDPLRFSLRTAAKWAPDAGAAHWSATTISAWARLSGNFYPQSSAARSPALVVRNPVGCRAPSSRPNRLPAAAAAGCRAHVLGPSHRSRCAATRLCPLLR
jgi:hypothetical protein